MRFSSWRWRSSSTPPKNTSKSPLRNASDVTRSVRKSGKVANIDEASTSDMNSDPSQSESEDAILQYDGVDSPLKWTKTLNAEQESPHLQAEKEGDSYQRELRNIEMERIQQELDRVRQEKEEISNELTKERGARGKAFKEFQRAKKEIEAMKGRAKSLSHELNATRHQINEYVVHCERKNQELQATREQLQRVEVVHQQTREQLAERTAELKSAQLFIDVADSVSGADIISMTASLNAEILQSAALMADSLDHTERRGESPNDVLLKEQEKIGENLMKALMDQRLADEKDVDPTLVVQLALQVCLVRCSKEIILSWTLRGTDDCLSDLYSRIWNNEKQPVAGRWRSMTQMHAAAVNVNAPDLALQMIVHAVTGILTVMGIDYHPFTNQFQDRLSAISTLSLRLRSSIGQYITSMEIRPFTIEPGLPFDPSQMEDTYAEEGKANSMVGVGGHVAGSTELGLISQVKDISGKVETKVMLKPKVVLCSALTEDG